MTLPSTLQRTLTSNLLIIPTVVVVGLTFWMIGLIRKNQVVENVTRGSRS